MTKGIQRKHFTSMTPEYLLQLVELTNYLKNKLVTESDQVET
jgi:hypothetical protein